MRPRALRGVGLIQDGHVGDDQAQEAEPRAGLDDHPEAAAGVFGGDVAEAEGEERRAAGVEQGEEVGPGAIGIDEGGSEAAVDEGEGEDDPPGPEDEQEDDGDGAELAEQANSFCGGSLAPIAAMIFQLQ